MPRSSDCNIHISLEFGYYVVGAVMKRRGRSGDISGLEMGFLNISRTSSCQPLWDWPETERIDSIVELVCPGQRLSGICTILLPLVGLRW